MNLHILFLFVISIHIGYSSFLDEELCDSVSYSPIAADGFFIPSEFLICTGDLGLPVSYPVFAIEITFSHDFEFVDSIQSIEITFTDQELMKCHSLLYSPVDFLNSSPIRCLFNSFNGSQRPCLAGDGMTLFFSSDYLISDGDPIFAIETTLNQDFEISSLFASIPFKKCENIDGWIVYRDQEQTIHRSNFARNLLSSDENVTIHADELVKIHTDLTKLLQLCLGVFVLVLVAILAVAVLKIIQICIWRPKVQLSSNDIQVQDSVQVQDSLPRMITSTEILSATNNLTSKIIRDNGFSCLFRAKIRNLGMVGVKRYGDKVNQPMSVTDEMGIEFSTKMAMMKNRHLVQLIGWSFQPEGLLPIFEYMPNGTLYEFLHNLPKSSRMLSFDLRLNILVSIASGIEFIHGRGCHGDIRSSNILLDQYYEAKLDDYELGLFPEHMRRGESWPAGTPAYLAPEYLDSGPATTFSDVYGFGVLILEVASGKLPVTHDGEVIGKWVKKLWRKGLLLGAADEMLTFHRHEMERVLKVGLLCVEPDPQSRPSISNVRRMLQGGMMPELELPQVTPAAESTSVAQNTPATAEVELR